MMKTFVGPHEGRELELMMAGTKPLSAFLEVVSQDVECFPIVARTRVSICDHQILRARIMDQALGFLHLILHT